MSGPRRIDDRGTLDEVEARFGLERLEADLMEPPMAR